MCQYEGVGYGCGHNEQQLLYYCHSARNAFRHVCLKPPDLVSETDILDENCSKCIENGAPRQRSEHLEPEPLLELPKAPNPLTQERLRELMELEKEEKARIRTERRDRDKRTRDPKAQQEDTLQLDSVYKGIIDIAPFRYPAPWDAERTSKESGADMKVNQEDEMMDIKVSKDRRTVWERS